MIAWTFGWPVGPLVATLALSIFFLALIVFASYLGNRCPATHREHDWVYFGAAEPPEPRAWSKYWDRQCCACGLYN